MAQLDTNCATLSSFWRWNPGNPGNMVVWNDDDPALCSRRSSISRPLCHCSHVCQCPHQWSLYRGYPPNSMVNLLPKYRMNGSESGDMTHISSESAHQKSAWLWWKFLIRNAFKSCSRVLRPGTVPQQTPMYWNLEFQIIFLLLLKNQMQFIWSFILIRPRRTSCDTLDVLKSSSCKDIGTQRICYPHLNIRLVELGF